MLLRLAILFLAVLVSQPAVAERKAALLIGNAAYSAPATELKNPPNDITAMKATLEAAGFEVTVLENAGRAAMSEALAGFEEKVAGADIGLIYYSGHGIEVNGDNFLIPVDAKLASDRDVKYETILLDDLLHALAGASKLKLVLLDACRDNPFLTSMKRLSTRGIPTRGLARVDSAETNMLIGYATAPGDVALDGDGTMSPYAAALTRHLVSPGLEVEAALRAVAKDVYDTTNGKQRPFKTGSLFENVMLGGNTDASTPGNNPDPCRDAAAHWSAISARKDQTLLEEHLQRFGNCAFASVARIEIAALTKGTGIEATRPQFFLYEERDGQTSPTATEGAVVWSNAAESQTGGSTPERVVRAQISVPSKGLKAMITFRRNADKSLPASHLIEFVFSLTANFSGDGIQSVQRVAMKRTEQDRGDALIGVPATITDDFHMVALNNYPEAVVKNSELLRSRDWIDVPITYKNGRRALLTLAKGSTGTQAFDAALNSWSNTTSEIGNR